MKKGITMKKKLFGLILILILNGCSKNTSINQNHESAAPINQHIVYQNSNNTFNRRDDTVNMFDTAIKISTASQDNQFTFIIDEPYNHTTNNIDGNYTDMSVTQNDTELVSNGVNISQSKLNTIDYKTTSMSYNHIDPSVPIKLKITDGKTKKILFIT